jgi:hypothetical protein
MSPSSGNDSDFEQDPRRKQELKGRPIADEIYHSFWGADIEIQRRERTEAYILDREFAVDVEIKLPTGHILLGQEKFLSSRYASKATVTVEYEQNQYTGEKGDWFRLAAQFYFVGYFTPDGRYFRPWILLDWPAVVLATLQGRLAWQDGYNHDTLASFKHIRMAELGEAQGCVWGSRGIP